MQQKKLSDFRETLKELEKMGAFTEEEMLLLNNLDKTMEEVSEETASGKYHIGFKNFSKNPDPVFKENKIILSASESQTIPPGSFATVRTGIVFDLPPIMIMLPRLVRTTDTKGLFILDHRIYEDDTIFFIANLKPQESTRIVSGEEIIDLSFVYAASSDTVELRKLEG